MLNSKRPFSRTRKYLTAASIIFASLATSPAFADDPCKMPLCMYGRLTGDSGGSDCKSAEKEYFAIKVKKKGKINWNSTAKQRLNRMNSCPTADRGKTKEINDKFGKANG